MATGSSLTQNYSRSQSEIKGDLHRISLKYKYDRFILRFAVIARVSDFLAFSISEYQEAFKNFGKSELIENTDEQQNVFHIIQRFISHVYNAGNDVIDAARLEMIIDLSLMGNQLPSYVSDSLKTQSDTDGEKAILMTIKPRTGVAVTKMKIPTTMMKIIGMIKYFFTHSYERNKTIFPLDFLSDRNKLSHSHSLEQPHSAPQQNFKDVKIIKIVCLLREVTFFMGPQVIYQIQLLYHKESIIIAY
ncbi:UNVERIFIED_CONTAM: hypothetical protein NCL1_27498 [Trichonephila clavipes]